MRTQSMHETYRSLLTELLHHGVEELNARTNTKIKMLQGAHSFKLDLLDGRLPVAGNRRYYPHIAAAEVAWQFMGTKDPTFIVGKAPKLWSKFIEDGELKTAYGHRWRKAFGRDQLELAMAELRNNPTNRQLYISAWDPSSDGLGGPQPKNIPCPVGFVVSRFRDDLHMTVLIRSSDVFVGLPYDVMGYALTLDAIAASVGCRPASLCITLAHPHLYEPHWLATRACLGLEITGFERPKDRRVEGASSTWVTGCEPNLPGWTVEQILRDPDGYVDIVKTLAKRVGNNSWDPMPEVIE